MKTLLPKGIKNIVAMKMIVRMRAYFHIASQ